MGIEVQLTGEKHDDWVYPNSRLAVEGLLITNFRLGTCDNTHAEEQVYKEVGSPMTAADLSKAYDLVKIPEPYVVMSPELAHLPKGDVTVHGADVLIDDNIKEYEEEAKQQEATTSKRKQMTKQIELTFIELEDTCKT